MRGATDCAKRLKQLFSSLRSKLGKVNLPAATDPITQLILGVLSRDTPETKASEGLERLRSMVVDYNELRVIPPIELAAIFADFPDARLKCEDISRALNGVFAQEHAISLDRLASLSRRDVQETLDQIDGLEPYTRARIRLLGLHQHAIPLDEAMWALLRAEHAVDARCPHLDAQQFLERQIAEQDALEFYALLKRHAWNELGAAVKKREVERILSVPPDRTSRNMLQTISSLPTELPGDDELIDEIDAPAPSVSKQPPPTRAKPPTPRPAKAAAAPKRDGPVKTAAERPRKARPARKSDATPAKRAATPPPARESTSSRRAKRSAKAARRAQSA
jgi:hypothetical protein